MRVFVTGASGFIGSAVVRELIGAGHTVVGLARSDASAEKISAAGAEVLLGSLDDLESIKKGADAADGVVHLAYVHDFGDMAGAAATDRTVIEAIGSVLAGSGRPFALAGGTLMLPPGRLGTEEDGPDPKAVHPRVPSEALALSLAARNVRVSVVRLAPSVHGDGDKGFVPFIINIAREKGVSAYVGDGSNRWPAVHRLDAAHLFRLAIEKAPAGSRLHGVGDEGIPIREIAAVIGRKLDLPVRSIRREEMMGHFSWMGNFISADCPASNALTRKRLGWKPAHRGLIEDLEKGTYFAA